MKFSEHLPPYLQGIALTDAQQKSIQALLQKNQDRMQAKEKSGMEYHHAIQTLVFSKDYSDEKLADLIKKNLDQHEEHERNRAKLDHVIYELLTVKQQQQVLANHTAFLAHLKTLK